MKIIPNALIAVIGFIIHLIVTIGQYGVIGQYCKYPIFSYVILLVIFSSFSIVNRGLFKDLNVFHRYIKFFLSSAALTIIWYFISRVLVFIISFFVLWWAGIL